MFKLAAAKLVVDYSMTRGWEFIIMLYDIYNRHSNDPLALTPAFGNIHIIKFDTRSQRITTLLKKTFKTL